jgi:hypothetical protein
MIFWEKDTKNPVCRGPAAPSAVLNRVKTPGPARAGRPGPPLEVQVSTWTSTANRWDGMIWFCSSQCGLSKRYDTFSAKFCIGSDARNVLTLRLNAGPSMTRPWPVHFFSDKKRCLGPSQHFANLCIDDHWRCSRHVLSKYKHHSW